MVFSSNLSPVHVARSRTKGKAPSKQLVLVLRKRDSANFLRSFLKNCAKHFFTNLPLVLFSVLIILVECNRWISDPLDFNPTRVTKCLFLRKPLLVFVQLITSGAASKNAEYYLIPFSYCALTKRCISWKIFCLHHSTGTHNTTMFIFGRLGQPSHRALF